MPLLHDHPRQPLGGHHFIEGDGLTIRAKTIHALIAAVRLYRENNARAAGNPALEVERFYAERFPWLVEKCERGEEAPAATPVEKEEMLRPWINRIWRNPPKQWQETVKANERLAICAKCPHRIESGNVSEVYLRRLIILGAGRFDTKALSCSMHRWSCGLAAWMVDPEVAEAVPGCWAGPKP